MAFNGAGDFSSGTCARPVSAASDKNISVIKEAGNEFINIASQQANPPEWLLSILESLCLSQNQFHPVPGNPRFKAALRGHGAELRGELALVARDHLRAAMSDDDFGQMLPGAGLVSR
jgi:hypothetical protein